ncbi:molecular chaperone Hsp33 [Melghirimyces profundicolus]|uniref:33 kDa chaperonin n=1 Tax=Melghirimyces profundicolus TaxID=1242148 RepID=A0A2T6BGS9_9BACL|nr:Hsp33 family molecular chaperone HslO [Melghirimyces profundicolus]PTX55260.1 molecular chaperone Hsp33 [Melghirimyces profundicolus]
MSESKDYAVRGTARNGSIRGFACVTTDMMNEMQRRHQTWPIASAALGRTVSAGAMMGMMLKNETDKMTIQVQGDGPLGQIIVDVDGCGHVRGYVENPAVDLPHNAQGKLNVGEAVGNGVLNVVKDLGLKEPYRGSVRLVSGELGEDFTYYLTVSEQVPSSVGVGVLVAPDASIVRSGGFIIQVLPEAEDSLIEELEQRIVHMPSVTKLLEKGESPEGLLQRILGDDLKVTETQPLSFQCHCSLERIHATLRSLGGEELAKLIEEQGQAEVICHFCNEAYRVPKEDLEKLKEEMK